MSYYIPSRVMSMITFSTHQSAISLLFKNEYTLRDISRLVSISNCLEYDRTVSMIDDFFLFFWVF